MKKIDGFVSNSSTTTFFINKYRVGKLKKFLRAIESNSDTVVEEIIITVKSENNNHIPGGDLIDSELKMEMS